MSKYIIGNWKMNGTLEADLQRANGIATYLKDNPTQATVIICPPFHEIPAVSFIAKNISKDILKIGAQDCHFKDSGAYTGDISPLMLKEVGCLYSIVGHSERRLYHHETNKIVADKAKNAIQNNIIPIICIGETKEDYQNKKTNLVLKNQIEESIPDTATASNTIIAYEPVWAIGTGLTPTNNEIQETHNYIKSCLQQKFPVLYGGSVNAKNSKEILAIQNVDGALIGGASLVLNDFITIINSI